MGAQKDAGVELAKYNRLRKRRPSSSGLSISFTKSSGKTSNAHVNYYL